MSCFNARRPSMHTFALAALIGSTILVGSLGVAYAAPATGAHLQLAQTTAAATPATAEAAGTKSDTIEDRIGSLHTSLQITQDEEADWKAVAQAMRDNASGMDKLVATKHAQAPQDMTALEDLQTYQAFAQAHVDGLKNLTSAFKVLYDAMPPAQAKNADQVFANFGHAGKASHS